MVGLIWPVCDGCNPMRMGGDISEDDLTCVESYMISLIDLASAPGRRRILAVYPCPPTPQISLGP